MMINHITDGEENSSVVYSWRNVVKDMKDLRECGNWTFTFLVPPKKKSHFVNQYGIESGNVMEWDTTESGLKQAEEQTTTGLFNYYEARSIGGQSVKNFYDVKVDLSKVNNLGQAGLNDLSNQFKKYNVDKECTSKELCGNLGITYKPGKVFYELTKPEKVQPTKQVLVIERGKQKIYGGAEARHLIGLPDNQYAKVDLYNLANYRVFVESRAGSGNRILVRGTDVLVKQ
jgi:hypothetical protein